MMLDSGTLGLAAGAVLAVIIFYFLLKYVVKMRSEAALLSLIDNADRLLEKDMTGEALVLYNEVLQKKSEWKDRKLYARVKRNEGICCYNLAKENDRAGNLFRAICAFEEALEVYSAGNFLVEFAMTQNNLGTAFSSLAEVWDRDGNLARAVRAYEDALEV